MTAGVRLAGKNGEAAEVSEFGQLIVAPISYNTSVNAKLAVKNIAYNMLEPVESKQIIIDSIILTADKNVASTDATVIIYEADSPDSAVSTNDILVVELRLKSTLPLTGLNLKVQKGKWINIKTDEVSVFATILYYRVPVF